MVVIGETGRPVRKEWEAIELATKKASKKKKNEAGASKPGKKRKPALDVSFAMPPNAPVTTLAQPRMRPLAPKVAKPTQEVDQDAPDQQLMVVLHEIQSQSQPPPMLEPSQMAQPDEPLTQVMPPPQSPTYTGVPNPEHIDDHFA